MGIEKSLLGINRNPDKFILLRDISTKTKVAHDAKSRRQDG